MVSRVSLGEGPSRRVKEEGAARCDQAGDAEIAVASLAGRSTLLEERRYKRPGEEGSLDVVRRSGEVVAVAVVVESVVVVGAGAAVAACNVAGTGRGGRV